jgi:hypothetical protein
MPESPSMIPGLMPMRSKVAESCDSISAEVMIVVGSAQATASMATFLNNIGFMIVLPALSDAAVVEYNF